MNLQYPVFEEIIDNVIDDIFEIAAGISINDYFEDLGSTVKNYLLLN